LYFLWNNDPGAVFRAPVGGVSGNADTIPIESVLAPESIIVNFGAENYTSPQEISSLWYGVDGGDAPSFMGGLAEFLASDNIAVGAISEVDFMDVMRARSIRADFAFAIPTIDFCAQFDLRRPAQIEAIETFTCVAYSEASPESVFLCNASDDRFYRLAVDGETRFRELIAFIETFHNALYYPLRTFSGVENDTLLPLDAGGAPEELSYERSPDPNDADEAERITEMARAFFGNRFDFTRKITEGDGATVYMYGYGEKVFVINRDGSFEYSAVAQESGAGAATMFGALTAALAFLTSHDEQRVGLAAAPAQIYLKDVQYAFADGRGTYKFLFGIKINGYTVYYADSEPLTIDVTGQQVSYYKRDMIEGFLSGQDDASAGERAFAPFDLLTEHFAYIYDVLFSMGLSAPLEGAAGEEAVFENVVGAVSGISRGLLRPSEGDTHTPEGARRSLLPIWTLTAGGVDFYFDSHTGAPAGHGG
jgi:hypothetical protein